MTDLQPKSRPEEEIELKFIVPPEHLPALSKAMRGGKFRVQRLQSIYYDTADERLAACGASLRLRKEGRQWVQTAKALTLDSLRRLEDNVDVPSPRGTNAPALDLARHDGSPAGSAIRAVLSSPALDDAGQLLVERFRIDVSRVTRRMLEGGASVELAIDTGKIFAGVQSIPVCEFEMELKHGPVAGLLRLAEHWALSNHLWLSTTSKAERGARLLRGETEGKPINAIAPVVNPAEGRSGFLVATLQTCLKQVLGNAGEVGAGAGDEQLVHQLRVGLRRMRTALRELKGFVPGMDKEYSVVLPRIFRELGAHRDIALVLPAESNAMHADGVSYTCVPAKAGGAKSPVAIVRDPEFQGVLLSVLALCHAPRALTAHRKEGSQALVHKVSILLDRLHAALVRDTARFEELPAGRQHRVRKRAKRFRYLAGFAAPLFDSAVAAHYLERWGDAQDALGGQNDHRISMAAIRADARRGRHAKRARRWLAKQLRTCNSRCARLLRKAVYLPVFWRE
ncbi:CHAD domain-containing protein [Variovorax sp. H27-G14]|uniref:CYTH and CHAD domain-containing protein n=1 Tax=Variovorax sp. H27-G14 TaxID=3111914 RepID=UPI0038FD1528